MTRNIIIAVTATATTILLATGGWILAVLAIATLDGYGDEA